MKDDCDSDDHDDYDGYDNEGDNVNIVAFVELSLTSA